MNNSKCSKNALKMNFVLKFFDIQTAQIMIEHKQPTRNASKNLGKTILGFRPARSISERSLRTWRGSQILSAGKTWKLELGT